MPDGVTFQVDIIVEPDGDAFHAYCPALTGLHVDGETEKDAVCNAYDAIAAYLVSLIKHRHPIPLAVIKPVHNGKQRHTERLSVSLDQLQPA